MAIGVLPLAIFLYLWGVKTAANIFLRRSSRFGRILRGAVLCTAILAGTVWAVRSAAAVPGWETVSPRVDSDDADRIDTAVRDGYIFITTSRPVTVRLYTILGQLVNQQNIGAGTSRFRVGSRGVYILKVGSVTRRITV